ncbi:hypothetical protein VPHF86_0243 [Vibrio phage F86]
MNNQMILRITNIWMHRRAYDVLFMQPAKFRKEAHAKWDERRKEFWYVAGRLNPEFFSNCPDGYVLSLHCAPVARNASQFFFLEYVRKTS